MYPQSASAVARMLSTNPAPNAGHRGGAFQRQPSGRGDADGDRKLVVITALLPPLFDVASKLRLADDTIQSLRATRLTPEESSP